MAPIRLFHFDIATYGNYGDTLLFEAVRETFEGFAGRQAFRVTGSAPLRSPVGPKLVDHINATADAVLLGGGGLFLSDTAANRRSGWQWNISLEQLRRIEVPLIVFAVGNNRFPGQPDFEDPFREHVTTTLEKSAFFGLRNHGSIRTIRQYVPEHLRERIVYQPCPTTISSTLFPDLYRPELPHERRLAVEGIVGKRQARAGFDADAIYRAQAEVLLRLAHEGWAIDSLPFARADLGLHEKLVEHGVPLASHERLFGNRDVLWRGLERIADIPTILGTRGHAQMVPFGLGATPLSLAVHDKIGYFAEDIGHAEWALDPRADDFEDTLYRTLHETYERQPELRAELSRTRDGLRDVTLSNLAAIYEALTGDTIEPSFAPFSPFERHLAGRAYEATLRRREADGAVAALRGELATAEPQARSLLERSEENAKQGDYAVARRLRDAAAAISPELVARRPTPRWDDPVGRLVPAPVLRGVRKLTRS